MKFVDLYHSLVKASLDGDLSSAAQSSLQNGADPRQLDCLLRPGAYPPVWKIEDCSGLVLWVPSLTASIPVSSMRSHGTQKGM